MNKIAIVTWLYKREEISKKVLKYFSQFDFAHFIAVGTQSAKTAQGTMFEYFEHENLPLGSKWNRAFLELKNRDFDYVLIIGSDDFLSKNCIDFYLNEANDSYYQFVDLFVANENDSYYLPTVSNCGAGMLVKREFLEAIDFKPVPDNIMHGFDINFKNNVLPNTFATNVGYALNKFILVDVKSSESMNKFGSMSHRGFTINRDWLMAQVLK